MIKLATYMNLKRVLRNAWISTFVAALLPLGVLGQDSDGDGVPDAVESELLSQFAPVWRADDSHQRPPLPLDWYVRH